VGVKGRNGLRTGMHTIKFGDCLGLFSIIIGFFGIILSGILSDNMLVSNFAV
jgi:hypothetical protein